MEHLQVAGPGPGPGHPMARYEVAWYPGVASPWCALLHAGDLAMLEAREDTKYFHRYLPAPTTSSRYAPVPVTTAMTAPLWADMVAALEARGEEGREEEEEEEELPRARLLFGHLSTVGHSSTV